MKHNLVLLPFPFDDLSATKVRPICLTNELQPYRHVVVAFITSQVPVNPSETDLVIYADDSDFRQTGLKVSSTIRLHRLITVNGSIVLRRLGSLPTKMQSQVESKLRLLFEI